MEDCKRGRESEGEREGVEEKTKGWIGEGIGEKRRGGEERGEKIIMQW